MVESFAGKVANAMKRTAPEQTVSTEIMKYGLILLINGTSVLLLSLLLGYFTGRFIDTLYTLLSYALLRFFAGGLHFKSAVHCIVFSVTLLTILPHIPLDYTFVSVLTVISLILLFIFAPSNIENKTRIPEKYFPLLKYASLIIVSMNFLILSPILAKTFFTISLLTVKLRW